MKNLEMMVDIETFSQRVNAAPASIGAVIFDTEKLEIVDRFYVNIDIKSSKEYGLHISRDTLDWWAKRPKEVFQSLLKDPQSLPDALDMCSEFFRKSGNIVWAHGGNFDFPILANAYTVCGKKEPWKFWNAFCSRTICSKFGIEIERSSDHHNALADAEAQAKAMMKFYEIFRE